MIVALDKIIVSIVGEINPRDVYRDRGDTNRRVAIERAIKDSTSNYKSGGKKSGRGGFGMYNR